MGKCHEAESMALCGEISFRSSLMRTESRGWHYREDYPEQDNYNWLNWIIVKENGGSMSVITQPVPLDKYKYKP
jgi:succinate dehydrogenase/fumarate reductase flavoprotein subunit